MRIIGVIDLKNGQAVHARGGRRDAYPKVGVAAGTAVDGSALELARVYRETLDLTEIYVADLDAIAGAEPQHTALTALSAVGASLLVDAGFASVEAAVNAAQRGADAIVVGLETLPSIDVLAAICREMSNSVIFSLDLRNGSPITCAGDDSASPEEIASQSAKAGAGAIIVLDVTRVGTGRGPDIDMLQRIRRAVPDLPVLAGGGVRGLDDLRQLAEVGCDGALVATALHDCRLTPADIAAARRFQRGVRLQPEAHSVSRNTAV